MKYPTLARGGRLAASVTALDGGLSCSYAAGDRQPSTCRNMHWQNGRLCTRRGFVTDTERYHAFALGDASSFFTDSDGYLLVLDCTDTEASSDVVVTVFDENGRDIDRTFTLTGARGTTGFLVAAGASLPLYTALLFVSDGRMYGIHAKDGRFAELHDTAYVPLVRLNGTPHVQAAAVALNGNSAEPLNALTAQFRSQYTADGEGIYYALPSVFSESPLYVKWTDETTVREFRIQPWETATDETEEYGVSFNRRTGVFWFTYKGVPYALPQTGLHNHIEATAQSGEVHTVQVSSMRFGTWYGGERHAEGGGTRLFLGGLNGYVMWSTPDNPLYFPVTAYAQVGEADDALTAFGKLGEWLVVFKRRSLYAMAYVVDSRVGNDTRLTDVDVTASAVFPITPLHAQIGCDLPHTVAVFDNRLLFACRDGTVYALSINGDTRRLETVSEPIRPLLTPPSYAAAIAAEGRYTLLWDGTCYQFDRGERWSEWSWDGTGAVPLGFCYNDTGWHIPTAVTVGTSRLLFWYTAGGDSDTVVHADGTSWADVTLTLRQQAVEGCVSTRLYDAGLPDTDKRLTAVFAEAEADDGVVVCYRTERGETAEQRAVVRDGVRLTPSLAKCRRFALCLRGKNLKLGGITFHIITR